MMTGYDNIGKRSMEMAVFLYQSQTSYRLLQEAFVQHISKPPVSGRSSEEQLTELYYWFLASLQIDSGLAGKGSKRVLLRLTVDSLRSLGRGWLYLPIYSGEIPMPLHPSSQLIAKSLLVQLSRGEGKGRNRVGEIAVQKLHPMLMGEDTKAGKAALWKGYRMWLKRLGKSAGFEKSLTYKDFQEIIQYAFYNRLESDQKPLIELQMCDWPHCPAPIEQEADFWGLAQPLDFEHVAEMAGRQDLAALLKLKKPQRIALGLELPPGPVSFDLDAAPTPPFLKEVQKLIGKYGGLSKRPKSEKRTQYKNKLEKIAKIAFADPLFKKRKSGSLSFAMQGEILLIGVIARWMQYNIDRRISPKMVAQKLSTLNVLLTAYPDEFPFMLNHEQLVALLKSKNYAPGSFNRILINLEEFRDFSEQELDMLIDANYEFGKLYQNTMRVTTRKLLTRFQLEEVLGCLQLIEKYGELTYYGALLQISFGGRVKSILEMNIDGVRNLLGKYPTALLPPIKGRAAFDAQLPAAHVDPGVMQALDSFLQRRLRETKGDGMQPFLSSKSVENFRYERYRSTLEKAMVLTGNWEIEELRGLSSHWLRHYAANRWLALGLPLEWIRDHMNHRQSSTTVGNYLHGISFVLARHFFRDVPEPTLQVNQTAVAFLCGISTRQVRNLEEELLLMNKDRSKYLWGEVTTMVEYFYQQVVGEEGEKD